MRGDAGDRGSGRSAAGRAVGARRAPWPRALRIAGFLLSLLATPDLAAQEPRTVVLERGRFTFVASTADSALARTMLESAERNDTFPGLPRPDARVRIDIASDEAAFRALIGPSAPEWGAAVAFPRAQRIVMQGRFIGAEVGNPLEILRHELAHLALHESLGELPPRWFDEGYASYAAGEWDRDETLATNFALVLRGVPTLEALDDGFYAGAQRATGAYAIAFRAVAELAALDRERGLALFFDRWRETRSMDSAMRAAYAITYDGFEKRWQARTRRRFGAVALVADLALIGIGIVAVLIPLQQAQRRRRRQRLELLRESEAAADRARREAALDEILRDVPSGQRPGSGPEVA